MKINITKLEELAEKSKNKSEENPQVTFEASGQGGFFVHEKSKNSDITTIVAKRNFKTVEIQKTIKNLKKNTTESYTYFPEGILQTYIKRNNAYKLEDHEIGEIQIGYYVKVFEKYNDNGSLKLRRNYDDLFKVSLQDMIKIARDRHFQDVGIYRVYQDEYISGVGTVGLTTEDFSTKTPYWVVSFRDLTIKTHGNHFIFLIFDGISGTLVKEKKMTVFTSMERNQ